MPSQEIFRPRYAHGPSTSGLSSRRSAERPEKFKGKLLFPWSAGPAQDVLRPRAGPSLIGARPGAKTVFLPNKGGARTVAHHPAYRLLPRKYGMHAAANLGKRPGRENLPQPRDMGRALAWQPRFGRSRCGGANRSRAAFRVGGSAPRLAGPNTGRKGRPERSEVRFPGAAEQSRGLAPPIRDQSSDIGLMLPFPARACPLHGIRPVSHWRRGH